MAGATITPYPNDPAIGNPAARGAPGPHPTIRPRGFPPQVIPDARIHPNDPTGQATPAFMNEVAQQQTKQQLLFASRNSVIPITYGGYERTAGTLYHARLYNGNIVIVQIIGEGPLQEISGFQMNDAPAGNGVTITAYLGTSTQGVDPTLAAAIPGFAEPMLNTAYIVSVVSKGVSTGFPRITALVKGLKVYDPRDGTQTLGVPSTYKWSDNPALCLADYLSNTRYGKGNTVDWTYVTTAANYCDEVVGTGPSAEKRALLSLSLVEKRPHKENVDILRAYVPGWVNYEGDVAYIVADAPRANDHTFTSANIDQGTPLRIRKRGIADSPNVVEIGYMRTDVTPWVMAYAVADNSPAVRRKARVDMPGIKRYSQARRFGIERLNHYQLEDIEVDWGTFENGLKVMVGDRAQITHDIGLAAKDARVLGKSPTSAGRWALTAREYDPLAYSSVVETTPSTPDTNLPNPKTVAAPTAMVIVETVYLEKNVPPDSLARGLIYQSRFDVTVTPPVHAYPFTYRWELYLGTQKLREEETTTPSWSTPAVQQGNTYTVNVFARNSLGFESVVLSGNLAALGKLLKPGDVPPISRAQELGGIVFLEWPPAIDIDTLRYEWRYFPNGTGTWDTAILLDRVDGLRTTFSGLPAGTHRFFVKAIDSVGGYSNNATSVDVIVTTDNNAIRFEREFYSPTLTNMVAWPMLEGVWKKRWATGMAADSWNANMPNPVNSGANPVISYHSSGTSKFVGESWDLGAPITGDWTLTPNTTNVTGVATYAIETSPDGSTWTSQAGLSFKGAARFVRPVIQTVTTGTMVITAPPKISLAALSKTEAGSVTTLASGGKLVLLTNKYFDKQDLQATAVNTSAARILVADRVLLYPQSGLMLTYDFNGAGDNYWFRTINTNAAARVIAAGDFIEYDLFIDPANPAVSGLSNGGLFIEFTDTTSSSLLTGTDGFSFYAPTTGLDVLARGIWYSRKGDLTAYVGKTPNKFVVVNHSDAASGTAKVLVRNVRITNGSGTDRAAVWPPTLGGSIQSEPSAAVDYLTNLVTNLRCGPSNTFLLYAFTDAGVQVAQDAQYRFQGF